ncbi:MAG: low specificity L-threonine aldolase [Bacillota bacterium]|nr:low specificity L-threonine aldolase [Bacillota bacterium]
MSSRFFASDNCASVHPLIMKALEDANNGHVISYGDDDYTRKAENCIKSLFNQPCEVFLVYNGTGANVTGLAACIRSFNSVLCPDSAHINTDECGAFEGITGAKLQQVCGKDGKFNIKAAESLLCVKGVEHHSQPLVVSITQSTELGTLYSIDEIKEIAEFAHKNGMFFHMDGARISNAAVALKASVADITQNAGVDVLSFGGTKNGMMFGEAVVFFNSELAKDYRYIRKQSMQLISKMRYVSAQYIAFLKDDLYLKNAENANIMAKRLSEGLSKLGFTAEYETVVNSVFVKLPKKLTDKLLKETFFYVWNEEENVVRLMTAFDTTFEDVDNFLNIIKKYI